MSGDNGRRRMPVRRDINVNHGIYEQQLKRRIAFLTELAQELERHNEEMAAMMGQHWSEIWLN